MYSQLEDHGLPLIQLKEQRRDMVAELIRQASISKEQISDIAAIQQAIAAVEAVITDVDAEASASASSPPKQAHIWLVA